MAINREKLLLFDGRALKKRCNPDHKKLDVALAMFACVCVCVVRCCIIAELTLCYAFAFALSLAPGENRAATCLRPASNSALALVRGVDQFSHQLNKRPPARTDGQGALLSAQANNGLKTRGGMLCGS